MIYSISFLLQENGQQHETIKPPATGSLLQVSLADQRRGDGSEGNTISKTIPSVDHNSKTHTERFKPQLVRSLSGSDDLEMLKDIGGTGTSIDPVTHHQRLSAFAKEFNSSRYEVSAS